MNHETPDPPWITNIFGDAPICIVCKHDKPFHADDCLFAAAAGSCKALDDLARPNPNYPEGYADDVR